MVKLMVSKIQNTLSASSNHCACASSVWCRGLPSEKKQPPEQERQMHTGLRPPVPMSAGRKCYMGHPAICKPPTRLGAEG